VYGLFRRWQRAGVWILIVAALQTGADAAGLITWDVSVDSTINRAHQHAAGARTDGGEQKQPPGGVGEHEPADHGLGRSRGGWTTKVHLAVEQGQKPLSVVVTAGQRGDSPQFQVVLGRVRVAPGQTVAGAGVRGRLEAPASGGAGQVEHRDDEGRHWRVRIAARRGQSWITVPTLEKLPEPTNLGAIKAEVQRRWGTIDLLDILKNKTPPLIIRQAARQT
jgi:hypothetical protein